MPELVIHFLSEQQTFAADVEYEVIVSGIRPSSSSVNIFKLFGIVTLSLEEERAGLYASGTFICLFILYALLSLFFLFLLVPWVGCGL